MRMKFPSIKSIIEQGDREEICQSSEYLHTLQIHLISIDKHAFTLEMT